MTSNYDRNLRLAELVFPDRHCEPSDRDRIEIIKTDTLDKSYWEKSLGYVDYCNNWGDLMPLVVEYNINWGKAWMGDKQGYVGVSSDGIATELCDSPQIALVDCLIKVLESKESKDG